MILFCLRSILLLQVLSLELVLSESVPLWTPQIAVYCLLYCGLRLEQRAVWQLLLPLMLFTSFLQGGGLLFHCWLVLFAFLLVLKVRKVLVPERWQMQVLLAFGLAAGHSQLRSYLLNEGLGDPMGHTLTNWLVTGLLAPFVLICLDLIYLNLPKLPVQAQPMPGSLSEQS